MPVTGRILDVGFCNHRCAGRPTALRGEEQTRSERNIWRSPWVNTDERNRRNVLSDKNINRDARPFLSLRHIGGNIWRAVLGNRGVGFRGVVFAAYRFLIRKRKNPRQRDDND